MSRPQAFACGHPRVELADTGDNERSSEQKCWRCEWRTINTERLEAETRALQAEARRRQGLPEAPRHTSEEERPVDPRVSPLPPSPYPGPRRFGPGIS